MADIIAQTNRLVMNIDGIMNRRIEKVKEIFSEEGRLMLAEFRARQYASPHIPAPKKSKADDSEKKAKARAYAEAHSGGTPLLGKGVSWINRSFRSARGVFSYIENNEAEGFIAVGLYHTMSYGAYLEFAHNRKFAVIEPIVRGRADALLAKVRQLYEAD
jgi:hypothetical protein